MLQLLAPFSSSHQLLAQSTTVISTTVVVSGSHVLQLLAYCLLLLAL